MPDRDLTPCRGCGEPILWATIDGKRIPLDVHAPVFGLEHDPDGPRRPVVSKRPSRFWGRLNHPTEHLVGVHHFATCPARHRAEQATAAHRRADGRQSQTAAERAS